MLHWKGQSQRDGCNHRYNQPRDIVTKIVTYEIYESLWAIFTALLGHVEGSKNKA